jgi:hypothetical protein
VPCLIPGVLLESQIVLVTEQVVCKITYLNPRAGEEVRKEKRALAVRSFSRRRCHSIVASDRLHAVG